MSAETKPNCPLETSLRPCQCEDMPRCPVCNYTDHDARFELDHGACSGKIPDKEPPPPAETSAEESRPRATELEYLTWFRNSADFGPAHEDVIDIMN